MVGGYAVIEYTEPRYTKDLDIWISTDRKNAEAVYSALKRFGAPLIYDGIPVQMISSADLVINKRLAGRPQDRIDVENLRLLEKRKRRR